MTSRKSRKILLLGEFSTTKNLGRAAESLGFQPVYHTGCAELPGLPRRDLSALKKVFEKFSHDSNAQGLVHPGVTAWAERPELQTTGQEFGLAVVAPTAKILSLFNNRMSFLLEVEKLGLHHLALSFDPFSGVREVQRFIKQTRQGFPFVLKSARGGGNFGVYVVHGPLSLGAEFHLWLEQLRWNVGEVLLFPEKYLEGSRHLSVPFVRLNDGKIHCFPVVDGSLQCRFRKIIEVCPPHCVDSEILEKVIRWTRHLVDSWQYVGFGSIEFLVDGSRAFVVGGQARLNTSYPLWEKVAQTSALGWQLHALDIGVPTPPLASSPNRGVQGIGLRIYAEDSLFHLPQPGVIQEVDSGSDSVTTGLTSGDQVSPCDSGLLCTVQELGESWTKALAGLREKLDQFWISGSLQTNERLLLELLNHPWVREGIFHTGFVDEEFLPQVLPDAEILEGMAACCRYFKESTEPRSEKVDGVPPVEERWIVGERWVRPARLLRTPDWVSPPTSWVVKDPGKGELEGLSGVLRIISSESTKPRLMRVSAILLNGRWLVRLGKWFMPVRCLAPKGVTEPKSLKRRLVALVSGRVHAVLFRKGVWVGTHDTILILESLGVFVPHALPIEVRVLEWNVSHGDAVTQGQELAVLEMRRTVSTVKKNKPDLDLRSD
ncbi:MAG: ATP-grasp domain-containing protein [Bdellovibrio sp.]|nr:ATP-grasp domain-containing protein [Bdellovibrio sp.]